VVDFAVNGDVFANFLEAFVVWPELEVVNGDVSETSSKILVVIFSSMTENRVRFFFHDFSQISWEKSNFVMTTPKEIGRSQKLSQKLEDVIEMISLCPFEKKKIEGDLGVKGKSWELS
jgi:hypothetical protein